MEKTKYELPPLPYAYDALEPYISKEIMTLHHTKHHQGYVNAANALQEKLWEAREKNTELDYKSVLKSLSFNVAGHILHSIFWNIMMKPEAGKNMPEGKIEEMIEEEFGSFERFKTEFSQAAISVEGSGWAALVWHEGWEKLMIMQIEKHNVNFYPEHKILLPLDVWEHSYYLDYKNDRAKFVEAFWNIIDWKEVEKRLKS